MRKREEGPYSSYRVFVFYCQLTLAVGCANIVLQAYSGVCAVGQTNNEHVAVVGEGRGHRGNVQAKPFTQLSIDLNALIANDALQHTVLHGPNVCLVPCVAHEVDGRKDTVTTHLANVGDGCLDCCAAIGPHIIAMESQIPMVGFWLTDGGIALAKLFVRDAFAKDIVPIGEDTPYCQCRSYRTFPAECRRLYRPAQAFRLYR